VWTVASATVTEGGTVSKFLTLLISGGTSGAIFAIMASGLVLTYETSGIFNLAHGAVAFVVALVFYELNTGAGWPVVPAAIFSVLVFAPLLGFLLDRLMLRRLAGAPVYARIVGTVGLLIAVPSLALFVIEQVNAHGGHLPTTDQIITSRGLGPVPVHVFRLTDTLVLDSDQLAIFVTAFFVAVGLWFLLRHTRLGLKMRADVDRRELAGLRGINTERISGITWMFSMSLAGLGGLLLAPFFGLAGFTYTAVVLGAMAAVVFAGFRSVPRAFVGGVLIGVIASLLAGYGDTILPPVIADLPGFRSAVPFVLTIGALLVLGYQQRKRAPRAAPREVPPPDYLAGVPKWRRRLPWIVVTALLIAYVLHTSQYWAGLIAQGMVFAIIFLSFVLVTGTGGMVNLCQAAFVTAGGFIAGWLLTHQFHWSVPLVMEHGRVNFVVVVVLAGLVGAAAGALIALPVRRLGTLELALATLAIGFVAEAIIFPIDSIRNGSTGYLVLPPHWGSLDFTNNKTLAIGLLVVFGGLTVVVHNLRKSASGRAIFAARSSDAAARTSGISPDRAKVKVFAVAAGIAGVGGALLSVVSSPFTNTTTPAFTGIIWLAVVVTLGIRRPAGAFLAGLAYAVFATALTSLSGDSGGFHDVVASPYFLAIFFGLGAIGLAENADGALARSGAQKLKKRLRKEQAQEARAQEARAEEEARAQVAETPATTEPVAAAMGPPALLELRGIRAAYGQVEVLHGIDLDIAAGSVTALLGSNGAGKSTLCAVIGGLLEASHGTVRFAEDDITPWSPDRRARAGIMLSPEARGIFPGLTVEENLAVWLPSTAQRTEAYAHFPVLGERRRQRAGLLSGGEQQMLALVGALVRPPQIFIADEPTLGLAPLAIASVCRTLEELRDQGTAVLLVEEKTTTVLELADRVALMQLGRIVWNGTRDELDAEDLTAAYLGTDVASPQ
jgi:ABC-type branched-subunit amino acid transport system ATPase component/branched-subunit amino acid ABC-type transport system permease component